MAPTPNLRQASAASPSGFPGNGLGQLDCPSWWSADRERFDALTQTRREILDRDKAMAKKAQSAALATLVSAISVYSADAMGAMSIPMGPGFLLVFVALLLVLIAAWLLDDRLIQQIRDASMRSRLWLDLVAAVRNGCIDLTRLESIPYRETETERLLRKEAAVAAQFLASQKELAPHLPIFGHCFTLEKA